jgi:PhzF family phenazine biosynthesis protein
MWYLQIIIGIKFNKCIPFYFAHICTIIMVSKTNIRLLTMKYWIVDAFAEAGYRGNPAAVVLVDEFPPKDEMQEIAKWFNLSETTFVQVLNEYGNCNIRWFTPNSEAPLCGHATIAASQILYQEGVFPEGYSLRYNSLAGELVVSKHKDYISLNFPSYPVESAARIPLYDDLVNQEVIYTGIGENCLFMELLSEMALYKAQVRLDLLKQLPFRALILTSQSRHYDFASRYFAPKVGIDEDPVCASAHCRLTPYWSKKLDKDDMVAVQASARGGVIKCNNLGDRVLISGKAVTVEEGVLDKKHIKEVLGDVA